MVRQEYVTYVYEDGWTGFLSCVYEAFYRHEDPADMVCRELYRPSLFAPRIIVTDPDRSERVEKSIDEKLGPRARELICGAFLNGDEGREMDILRFLRFAYPQGKRAAWFLGHEAVAPLLAREKAVRGEAHLFTGFVRFSQYDDLLVSVISPRHYVLPFLRSHFCDRFPDENFMICDDTHKAVLLYQDHQACYQELVGEFHFPRQSPAEEEWCHRWKAFYQALSIRERENPKCRMTHCPKRFWAHMTELKDEL